MDNLNHGLNLLDGNLVDVVLQLGNRIGLKPGVLGDRRVCSDGLREVVESRSVSSALSVYGRSFARTREWTVLSPRNARLLWFGCWSLWKTWLSPALMMICI